MTHLGDRAAPLADGELGHDERDRWLAHLTHCVSCRAELDDQRRVKQVLGELHDPLPSPGVVRALLRMAEPGEPLPPERRAFPQPARERRARWMPVRTGRMRGAAPRGPATGRPDNTSDRGRRPSGLPRSARQGGVRLAAFGVLTAAAVTFGLASLGTPTGASTVPVSVVPPIERFVIEHSRSTGSLPFVEPAVTFVEGGTTGSGRVSSGATVPAGETAQNR